MPEVLQLYIKEFAKPHPFLIRLNEALKVINRRYWKSLRQALIGPDAFKVNDALKNFLDSRLFLADSQRSLTAYEDVLATPHLPYYGVLQIRNVWYPETDDILTYEQKQELVKKINNVIGAEMNQHVSFLKLMIKIGENYDDDDI